MRLNICAVYAGQASSEFSFQFSAFRGSHLICTATPLRFLRRHGKDCVSRFKTSCVLTRPIDQQMALDVEAEEPTLCLEF